MKKIYICLPLIFIFIVSCQKEELLLPDELQENLTQTKEELFTTIARKNALDYLKHIQVDKNFKAGEITIFYDQFRYDSIINSEQLVAVIPAQTKYPGVKSRILMLEVAGETKAVLLHKIAKEEASDRLNFSGRLIVTNLNLEFITGFKVEDGISISRFTLNNSSNKNTECDENLLSGDFCDNELEEVVLIAPQQPANTVPVAGIFESPDYQDSSLYEDQSGYIGYEAVSPMPVYVEQQKNNLCGTYNWIPVGHASVVNLSGLGFSAKNGSTGASINVEFSSVMCITLPYTIPQHASGLFNTAWNETMNQVYSYLSATHQVTPVPDSESIKILIKELLINNLKNDIHYNASMNTGGCYNVPNSTAKYCN